MPDTSKDPDTLQVSIEEEREREANGANVFVTVEGTSLITGEMALRKAREVAALVAALEEVGIAQSDINLQGVRADTAQGKILKASAASYRLRVRCEPLDKLADVLGVVTTQKSATLSHITWRYPDSSAEREAWLDECLAEAGRKARRMAAALGVRLLGVHRCNEQYAEQGDGPEPRWADNITLSDSHATMRRARVSPEELGLEVSHTKRTHIQVTVYYRVSDFGDGTDAA